MAKLAGELHPFGVREDTMRRTTSGFSLIEILLVVGIIGLISAIAIPAFLGQKKNAELVGDAQQNAKSLQMMLETRKADTGLYGAAGTTIWKSDGTVTGTNLAPLFAPQGSTKMTYTLNITGVGLTYNLLCEDKRTGNIKIFETDQTGRQIYPVP